MATTATTRLQFRLLGALEVLRDGEALPLGGERQRGLLAILLLRSNELVTTEHLAEQLFGSEASAASIRAVRVAVSRLRRLLDDGTLETGPGGYLARVDPGQLDVFEFESLVAEGRTALDGGDPAAAAASFAAALALFRGPPLGDLALVEFVQPEVRRLEELRLSALMSRIDADLALGRDGELVPELEVLALANPFQERLRGQLMLALYRSGRQTEALEVYRQTRELLVDDLGLEPSRALQELERAMLQHDPALDQMRPRATPTEATTCPFKGLAAFEAADAFYFCGREHLLDEIVTRLASGTFFGIVGPSGVGKSSLLRAGILPALAAGALPGSASWPVVFVRGSDLAAEALREAADACRLGERVVIAVDQLEEVFAEDVPAEGRSAFLDQLEHAAADPARRALVLVAVRADFYGRFADYPRLADRLSTSHVFLRSLDEDELARAIEVPASRSGLEVERSLVGALVADTAGAAGALPLLQTTLLQLWAARDGRVLRHDVYRAMGGLRGAVARLAEETFTGLPADDREVARRIMLRLAGGEEGALVRRRVPLADIRRLDGGARVVDGLVAARLLTVDDELVELSHEALLHEWPRYREWLADDRVGRRTHAHLTASAGDWEARDRDNADLYRGARLNAALELPRVDLTDLEREFLDASRVEAEQELHRQRADNRRLRWFLTGAGVLLLAAVVAGIVAFQKSRTASNEARIELAGRLGDEAVAEPRIDRAMLLARESLNLNRSSSTEGTLLATLLRTPAVTGTYTMPIQDRPQEVQVSPDGRSIAVVTNGNVMRIFDTRTHRQTGEFPAANFSYAYVPTSGDLFVADPRPRPDNLLVDPRTGRTLGKFTFSKTWQITRSSPLEPFAGSPDGRYAFITWAVFNSDGSAGPAYVESWKLDHSGPSHLSRLGATGMIAATALPGDRLEIATDGRIVTWDARTRKEIQSVPGPKFGANFVNGAISPDGRTFAYGLADGTVHFFDIEHHKSTIGLGGHAAPVQRLAFSPDSRTAASVSDDGIAIVWDPSTGQQLGRLTGHSGRVLGVDFSPNGRTLFTAGLDGTVLEYDLGGSSRFGTPFSLPAGSFAPPPTAVPNSPLLAPSPDGRFVAANAAGNANSRPDVAFLSASSPSLRRVGKISLGPGRTLTAGAWAGGRFVVGADRGLLQLWNVSAHPAPGARFEGLTKAAAVRSVATADVGRVVAAVDGWNVPLVKEHNFPQPEGELGIWRDGKLVGGRTLKFPKTFGNAVALSADGSTAAAATDDGRVLIVNTQTGALERTLRPKHTNGGVTAVAFSPDGTLATGSWSGIVNLWNPIKGREIGHPTLVAPAPVSSISFSPGGKTFATSGGSSGGARIWATATQQQVGADFPGGQGEWGSVAFTPDGRYLFTVFSNGSGYRWPASVGAWADHACAVAGRNFTREEWARYVPHHSYTRVCS
jgi:WD40 repeat protein/DNA-binding SARP family transcriptional activator/energy-coupling factor transporter ATP-binding protein EcfA2